MDETQRARKRAEARAEAVHRSGANRNRFWAGLNRYLPTETERERKAAKKEQDEAGQDKSSA
ncbi:MAG TPA: hypothetical protein VFJ09_15665 [Nocardioidaceae bacterium]|jgi:hypothetical protein|nr:hypothetical protein [Nocardioidaceae bacterium]